MVPLYAQKALGIINLPVNYRMCLAFIKYCSKKEPRLHAHQQENETDYRYRRKQASVEGLHKYNEK